MISVAKLDPDEMPPWIASLCNAVGTKKTLIAGVDDDDCAVVRLPNSILVATCDYLNSRPIAMELEIGTFYDLGRLLVGANVSDLCGSGAKPLALMPSIMLPRQSVRADFEQIMKGVIIEANRYDIPIIGGDSKLGDAIVLHAVALGTAEKEEDLFLRGDAEAGDDIWVSGFVGSCNAAVIGLSDTNMPQDWIDWARTAIVEPSAPLEKSVEISTHNIGRGGTDLSDGLAVDLHSLCRSSRVGAVLDSALFPIHPQARKLADVKNLPSWSLALGCGGDLQFIVTAEPGHREAMMRIGMHRIGEITGNCEVVLSLPTGQMASLPDKGHRDARNMSFAEENLALIASLLDLTETKQ